MIDYGKKSLGESVKQPKIKRGWSLWIENGEYFTAKIIPSRKFGQHAYMAGFNKGIRDCPCGCYMSGWSSSGPVDPFGPCPLNPKKGK